MSLCHPKFIEVVSETTWLIQDIVVIIGEYWIPLSSRNAFSRGEEFYFEPHDAYQSLDGQEMERIKSQHDDRDGLSILMDYTYWMEDDESHSFDRVFCSLGKSYNIYILRVMTGKDMARWYSSMCLTKLFRFMPTIHLNKFLETQHHFQRTSLGI